MNITDGKVSALYCEVGDTGKDMVNGRWSFQALADLECVVIIRDLW